MNQKEVEPAATPLAISERVRLIRLAYGELHGRKRAISQSEFARFCGIGAPTWNNIETGDNRIGLENALAVCRKTGASLDYIYLGNRACLPHALAIAIETIENRRSLAGSQ